MESVIIIIYPIPSEDYRLMMLEEDATCIENFHQKIYLERKLIQGWLSILRSWVQIFLQTYLTCSVETVRPHVFRVLKISHLIRINQQTSNT